MTTCPGCGALVRNSVSSCPRCGQLISVPRPWVWWAILLVFLGIGTLYMLSRYP